MNSNKRDSIELIHSHAWNWFAYHAAQRMTVFRFFFLILGLFAVGYHQSIERNPELAFSFSVLCILLTILFWRLDLRTRELIKISEEVLTATEKELTALKITSVKILQQAETKKTKFATSYFPSYLYSYGQIFTAIFRIVLVAGVIAAICAFRQTK